MTNITAIQERFEALAAEALEELIEDVEARDAVRVVALEVKLVPDHGAASPTVAVQLTVVPESLSVALARRASRQGRQRGGPAKIHSLRR